MKLTGKLKEGFLVWVMSQSNYTDNSNHLIRSENSERGEFLWYGNETDLLKEDKFLNALIIEYLDSAGVYVNIKSKFGQRKQCERFSFIVKRYNSGFIFNSRTEAINAAIEKANELINKI